MLCRDALKLAQVPIKNSNLFVDVFSSPFSPGSCYQRIENILLCRASHARAQARTRVYKKFQFFVGGPIFKILFPPESCWKGEFIFNISFLLRSGLFQRLLRTSYLIFKKTITYIILSEIIRPTSEAGSESKRLNCKVLSVVATARFK